MNVGASPEWDELAALWRRETASISLQDLQRRLRRNRWRLFAVVVAELFASAVGMASGMWLALATPMRYVGWGFVSAITIFTVIAVRRRRAASSVGQDFVNTLQAIADREKQTLEILEAGRVVLLAALAAVVVAASARLQHFQGAAATELLPLISSSLYLIAVMIGRAWFARRTRRHIDVVLGLRARMLVHNNDTDDAGRKSWS